MTGSFVNVNAFQGLLGVGQIMQPNNMIRQLADRLASSETANPATEADLFTLSPTADMMRQFLNTDLTEEGERGEMDLTGLAQLKQRGEMLSGMLRMKLKSFESNLISSMKSAGLDPTESMELKDGKDGLFLQNDSPDKNALERLFKDKDSLRSEFQDIARLASLVGLLDQLGGSNKSEMNPFGGDAGVSAATRYARQSQPTPTETVRNDPKPSEARFVFRFLQDGSSYTFK